MLMSHIKFTQIFIGLISLYIVDIKYMIVQFLQCDYYKRCVVGTFWLDFCCIHWLVLLMKNGGNGTKLENRIIPNSHILIRRLFSHCL